MKKVSTILVIVLFAMSASSQVYMKLDASFYSPSLDMVKNVDIYLPGDYYVNLENEYPVIYYLHGAGGNQNSGNSSAMLYYQNHTADTNITSPPAILVSPDGSCEPYLGCMWLNSPLYGNYEDYFIYDVIDFVESNFRVIRDKNFRFAYGISMGGNGSAYHALKHPELFRAVCPSSAAFSFPDTLLNDWREAVYNENDGFILNYNAGNRTKLLFTTSGGFAPNMEVEPWHFKCIFDTLGNVVDSVFEKWQQYNCSNMVKDLSPEDNLSFYLICGTRDEFIFYPTNLTFEDTLRKYQIEYKAEYYDGTHGVEHPVLTKNMFGWMDSLISMSYMHLGIDEQFRTENSTLRIELFPNPASDVVHIQYFLEQSTTSDITVINHLGQTMMHIREGWNPDGLHKRNIDISGLPAGLYFIQMQSGGVAATAKLVKQ